MCMFIFTCCSILCLWFLWRYLNMLEAAVWQCSLANSLAVDWTAESCKLLSQFLPGQSRSRNWSSGLFPLRSVSEEHSEHSSVFYCCSMKVGNSFSRINSDGWRTIESLIRFVVTVRPVSLRGLYHSILCFVDYTGVETAEQVHFCRELQQTAGTPEENLSAAGRSGVTPPPAMQHTHRTCSALQSYIKDKNISCLTLW